VPDVHNLTSAGAQEARISGNAEFASMGEMKAFGPWYEKKIAQPLDLSSREVQPVQWTVFGPQTKVKTRLGMGKAEMLANRILQTAIRERLPISRAGLKEAKRRIYSGETYALPFAGVPLGIGALSQLQQDRGQ
jgi:hypothetical protein